MIGRRRLAPLPGLLCVLLLLAARPAPAAARDIVIEDFDAELVVLRSGALAVEERLVLRFEGAWEGVYRELVLSGSTDQGARFRLRPRVLSVTDEGGAPLRWETSRQNGRLQVKVWVPGARDARRVVKLRYRVEGALLFSEEEDRLYWQVTGDDWPFRIERASARVHLPEGAAGVATLAFTGGQRGDVARPGEVVELASGRPLAPGEGFTVDVRWDPGLVARPTAADRARLWLPVAWAFLVPLLVAGLMGRQWHRRGRDPRSGSVAVWYEPPDGLRPGHVGALADTQATMREVTAMLVDLSIRGFITIEEESKGGLAGVLGGEEHVFYRKQPGAEAEAQLGDAERQLLDALFEHGRRDRVRVSELKDSFHEAYPDIHEALWREVVERGYFDESPERVRTRYMLLALLGVVVSGASGFLADMSAGTLPALTVIAAILAGIPAAIFAHLMPARTTAGGRTLSRVLGFKEFLSRVESERFKRMIKTPADFEKYLPYAMALGVDKEWTEVFGQIYQDPAQHSHWYAGSGPFRPIDFHTSFASGAMPSSSGGGGGFGGGGGGGVGGGGGGGF